MEPVGLAASVIGLAGLFNNAVENFDYIQLSRNFGTDFQTCVLRLDVARLRLSRWGEAVGLSGDIADAQSLTSTTLSPDARRQAELVLGQILSLFENAERSSEIFKNRTSKDDAALSILDVNTDTDANGRSLHEKMRNLSIKRQNKTPLTKKVRWALYSKKAFIRLIDAIVELLNDLVKISPEMRESQRHLCEYEVSEIGTEDSLHLRQSGAADQDEELKRALSKAQGSNTGASNNTWNNYNTRVGQQVGTQNVHGTQTISL